MSNSPRYTELADRLSAPEDSRYLAVLEYVQRTHTDSHSEITHGLATMAASLATLTATVTDLAKRQDEDRRTHETDQRENSRIIAAGTVIMAKAEGAITTLKWMFPSGLAIVTIVISIVVIFRH